MSLNVTILRLVTLIVVKIRLITGGRSSVAFTLARGETQTQKQMNAQAKEKSLEEGGGCF